MTWFLDKEFLAGLDLRAYDAPAIAARLDLPVETVSAFVDPLRRYWVKSSPDYGWLAGANAERQPTLLFVGSPRLASATVEPLNAVSFDLRTGAIRVDAIPLAGELAWEPVLAAAQAAIGFVYLDNAPVLAFKHPTIWHYAVVPFPFDIHDDVLGQGDGDPRHAREWIEHGNAVLHCGNAYYLGPDGDVESS